MKIRIIIASFQLISIAINYIETLTPIYRGFVNWYFYKSEESFYFLWLLVAGDGQTLSSAFIE